MNKRKINSVWIDLYNALFILSSEYEEIKYLQSATFDVFDELDTAIINGLNEKSLDFYLVNNWISVKEYAELEKLKKMVESINDELWSHEYFENHDEWLFVKEWANHLISKLNIEKDGWKRGGHDKIINC